jgi:hypothetical protein
VGYFGPKKIDIRGEGKDNTEDFGLSGRIILKLK